MFAKNEYSGVGVWWPHALRINCWHYLKAKPHVQRQRLELIFYNKYFVIELEVMG